MMCWTSVQTIKTIKFLEVNSLKYYPEKRNSAEWLKLKLQIFTYKPIQQDTQDMYMCTLQCLNWQVSTVVVCSQPVGSWFTPASLLVGLFFVKCICLYSDCGFPLTLNFLVLLMKGSAPAPTQPQGDGWIFWLSQTLLLSPMYCKYIY